MQCGKVEKVIHNYSKILWITPILGCFRAKFGCKAGSFALLCDFFTQVLALLYALIRQGVFHLFFALFHNALFKGNFSFLLVLCRGIFHPPTTPRSAMAHSHGLEMNPTHCWL